MRSLLIMLMAPLMMPQAADSNKLTLEPVDYTLTATAKRRVDRQVKIIENEYRPTGETRSCLQIRQIRGTNPVSDTQIWFNMTGSKAYLNTTNGQCFGLAQWDRFTYQTTQTRTCNGDIITVLDNFGIRTGSCGLGEFAEYERIPKDERPK